MATLRTATIKVKPDWSAFREADVCDITDLLEEHLLQYMPRNRSRADLRVVAQALANQFTILPKD